MKAGIVICCRDLGEYQNVPVYLQDWFTAIAEKQKFARKEILTENGDPVASLSLSFTRNGVGMKQAHNLPWVRLCGLRFRDEVPESRKTEMARQLLKQLPENVSYFLTVASEFDYGVFCSLGFEPVLEHNYIITPDQFPNVTHSFSSLTKRHLKQANRQLIVSSTTADSFIGLYQANLNSRLRRSYAPLEVAHELLREGLRRKGARIFTAVNRETGEIDAAVACLWDDARYYYWMTTRRRQRYGQTKAHQGAVKLLLWSAIQDAAAKNLIFDFDGAPNGGSVRLYEGMGGKRTLRYRMIRRTKVERYVGTLRRPLKRFLRNTLGRIIALKED
jgi:hypothetical protein